MKTAYISKTPSPVLNRLSPEELRHYLRVSAELVRELHGWDLTAALMDLASPYIRTDSNFQEALSFSRQLFDAVEQLRQEIEQVSHLLGATGATVLFERPVGSHVRMTFTTS